MSGWFTGWNLNLSSIIPTHADIQININDPHAEKNKANNETQQQQQQQHSRTHSSTVASPASNQTDVIILPTTPTAKKLQEVTPIYTSGDIVSGDIVIT